MMENAFATGEELAYVIMAVGETRDWSLIDALSGRAYCGSFSMSANMCA